MPDQDEQASGLVAVQFREFVLSLKPLSLSRRGRRIELPLQPLRLLEVLVTRAGNLVTHDELRRHLWGERIVSYNKSIHVYISQIRAALGDDADSPSFIENVPRQGYRFLPLVRPLQPHSLRQREHRWLTWFAAGAALSGALTAGVYFLGFGAPSVEPGTDDAWDAYRRGVYLLDRREVTATEKSLAYFELALVSDPTLAGAHLGAAQALGRLGRFEDAVRRAERSLELDDRLAEAYVVLGLADLAHSWEWEAARENFLEALKRDRTSAPAHQGIATYYVLQGDMGTGLSHMRRARQLDPASTIVRADFGWFYYFAGEYEEAATTCAEAVDLAPTNSGNRHCLIRSLTLAGKYHEAVGHMIEYMKQHDAPRREIAALVGQPPTRALRAFDGWRVRLHQLNDGAASAMPATLAFTAASVDDFDSALRYVDQAVRKRDPMIPFIAIDPVFDPVRDHPRFEAALEKLNLGET